MTPTASPPPARDSSSDRVEALADHPKQRLHLHRLVEEFAPVGEVAGVSIPGNHHGGKSGSMLAQLSNQLEPTHSRHVDVGEDQIEDHLTGQA